MQQIIIKVPTKGRGTYDITQDIQKEIKKLKCDVGLCNLFIQHTSASLLINENYDPQVRDDIETFLRKTVPDGDPMFLHNAEGPDDMPSHIRTMLTTTSLSAPIQNGELVLGRWQGIYLYEHRTQKHQRRIILTIIE